MWGECVMRVGGSWKENDVQRASMLEDVRTLLTHTTCKTSPMPAKEADEADDANDVGEWQNRLSDEYGARTNSK